MKSKKIVLRFCATALLFGGVLAGCSADYTPAEVSNPPPIQYRKEQNGLCFAYVNSRVAYRYVVVSISKVSCKEVGL
jgi:hypothetical protein